MDPFEALVNSNSISSFPEFQWLSRAILVLCALGDVAFRELTVYFEQVPCDEIPNWILPNLNVSPTFHTLTSQVFNSVLSFQFAAIYIRGKKDVYFYEYMQEACGDGLLPFMIFYSGERQITFNQSRFDYLKVDFHFRIHEEIGSKDVGR